MLGKTLSELRKRANISQETLARKLDVTRQTIYNWEANLVIPSADKLSELSKIFKVPIESFFEGEIAVADSKQEVSKTDEKTDEAREELPDENAQKKTLRRQKLKKSLLITLLSLCGIGVVVLAVLIAVISTVAFSNTGHEQVSDDIWHILPSEIIIILSVILFLLIGIITTFCIIRAIRKKKANVKDVLHDIN